jgi:hypothetical protein
MTLDADIDEAFAIIDAGTSGDDKGFGGYACTEKEMLPIAIFCTETQPPTFLALDLDEGQQAVDSAVCHTHVHSPWTGVIPRACTRQSHNLQPRRDGNTSCSGRRKIVMVVVVAVGNGLKVPSRLDANLKLGADLHIIAHKGLMLGVVGVAKMAVASM